MSEFPWNEVFTIVGVIVGFSLSQIAILIKSEKNKRSIKRALINELSVVKDSLSYAETSNKLPRIDCL